MQTSKDDERLLVLNALCRQSFDAFSQKVFSIIEPAAQYEYNWHIGCIAEHLEAVYRGEISKLIILEPPRSLKTFQTAVAFPAWVMGRTPSSRFISTSYSSTLAEQSSIKCRDIVTSTWFRKCFDGHPEIRKDQNHKDHWENTQNGAYYSAGICGTITGIGCHYFLVDDPLKASEAPSETVRVSTNQALRNTAFSRFNDPRTGRFVMIMQRLHEDDPAGHLMADGGYHVLKLPAETKRPILVTLGNKHWGMPANSMLFPARLTRKFLDEQRINLTEYHYAAQYLMSPVPLSGGEIKPEWAETYRDISPKTMNVYIMVDPAGGEEMQKKKKKLSDRTTMMVVGLAPDKNRYWLDGICDRLNPTERVDTLFELHLKWAEILGKSPKVGYEKYGMQSDLHYIKKKQDEESYHFSLVELGGRMEKTERIRRMIPDLQHGNWFFPADILRTDYMGRTIDLVREMKNSEMPTFPRARYDDMLDAISRIYDTEMNAVFPAVATKAGTRTSGSDRQQGWLEA